MATRSSHNKNNAGVKRIMQEAKELANDPSTDYAASPLEDDIFEWHCTLRGPPGTEFEGGLYHFRIILPAEYPFRPPSIMMLTPNGRFELNTKICISFTSYHEELWQPAWGVRTAIIGLQGFFPLKGQAAMGVGSLEAPISERRRLAKQSREWVCPHCQTTNLEHLPDPPSDGASDIQRTEQQRNSEETPYQSLASPTLPTSALTSNNIHITLNNDDTSPSIANHDLKTSDSTVQAAVSHTHNVTVNLEPAPSALATQSTSIGHSRPPFLLDAAIAVLLVLVGAMVLRKLS